MRKKVLYHGSKNGLQGKISVSRSRPNCDFGQGFYLGEDKYQAVSRVLRWPESKLYMLQIEITDGCRILNLSQEKEWLYTVLACRGVSKDFNCLPVAKRMLEQISKADLVIGKIADDRMNDAIDWFCDGLITDRALYECLRMVKLGNQYAVRNQKLCDSIAILDVRDADRREYPAVATFLENARSQNDVELREIRKRFRGGFYLDEIIENEMKGDAGEDGYDGH